MSITHDRRWDIVVVGGANTDLIARGPRSPRPGETIKGTVFRKAPGGKGANQAVQAARLGMRVAFVGRVGLDLRGDMIVDQLEREGIETGNVLRDAEVATGVALVQVDIAGQKQILSAAGANQRLCVSDITGAQDKIEAGRLLLTQLEAPLDCIREAIEIARAAGVLVFLDPSPAVTLPQPLLKSIDLIKPDASEASILTGIDVTDRNSARQAARQLIDQGVRAVAIEAGDEGNLIVTLDEEHFFDKIPVETVDATGAGDAFIAALAVARLDGRSWQEAGELASAAAALTTTRLGAQAALPTRDEVIELLKENGVTV